MTATIGFLSVRHHTEHGYFGGLLAVNQLARPLEFHCTLAVKPSRAQQVLYGPTIDEFVCGEQIAKALMSKAKLRPTLVVTDTPAALAVNVVSQQPIALLNVAVDSQRPEPQLRTPGQVPTNLVRRMAGDVELLMPIGSDPTDEQLRELVSNLSENFDFAEPFNRVIEALVEAHPIAKAA